ncbi:MAG TPA: hypothetical protein DET40_11255 [Lentisphaeria bacterium]|nr:MAG: hypothetical protein A2X45_19935 [Lentisphaerae bacterium GWF2_50_93]HCE44116.1 hypothetical protein [Lentisphaeria bacterium]
MAIILLFAGILIGFFLPGFLLNRIINRDNDFASAYIVSTVILFHAIFWTGVCGFKTSLVSIGIILILTNLSLFCYCLAKGIDFKTSAPTHFSLTRTEKLALIPVLLSVLLIFLKSSLFHTPGDQIFRWYFLAFRILETGSFSFYPPLTADDYNLYFYTDSFPPIASFSYFWLYSLFGKAENVLVCIPVTIQFILILVFGYRLSTSLFNSKRTGIFSILLMGSSALLFYSVMLSQETGITALSVTALVYFLVRRNPCTNGDAMMAAFAASLGALSREYGGIFIVCGIIVITWRRIPLRILFYFLLYCAIFTIPWYIRTLILTGNPFYSNQVFGLLAVNPVHTGILDGYREALGLKRYLAWDIVLPLATGISLVLGIPFFTGLISTFMQIKKLGFFLLITALMFILWMYSLQIVPGGLYHSMRILSPVIAILAICGSYFLDYVSMERPKLRLALLCILSCMCLLTLIQNIVAPFNPLTLKFKEWPMAAGIVPESASIPELDMIQAIPEGSKILSDNAHLHAILALNGRENRNIRVIPVWSPEVQFLFEKEMSFDEGVSRLKKCGINYVFLMHNDNLNMIYLRKFQFFQKLQSSSKPLVDGTLFELP